MKRGSQLLLSFLVWMLCSTASACPTREITLSGNLDRGTAFTAPWIQLPSFPTFDELNSIAQVHTSVTVYDTLGASHEVFFYFFHIAENPGVSSPEHWEGRIYVIGPDGKPGWLNPYERISISPGNPYSQTTAAQNLWWPNGARVLRVRINLSQIAESDSASVLNSSQNGTTTRCPAPVRMDFDGDGVDDYTVFRPSSGYWAVMNSSLEPFTYIWKQWGLPGDMPMPGDYTGDGKADLVVWRESNGTWYVCTSDTNFDCTRGFAVQLGTRGDRPVSADYDGDGILDFAIWRLSAGRFFNTNSSGSSFLGAIWGLSGDIPPGTGSKR